MAKTQEELNSLKEEVETVSRKLHELTEEELAQVTGGIQLVGLSVSGRKGDLFRVMDTGGQPVIGKQVIITLEDQEKPKQVIGTLGQTVTISQSGN